MRIVIFSNSTWNITNYRIGLVKKLLRLNYKITVLAPKDKFSVILKDLGCDLINIKIDRRSVNIIKELILFIKIFFIYFKTKPNICFHFTIKPVIYGSLINKIFNIRVINTITGLGTTFIEKKWYTKIVEFLYKISIRKNIFNFFHNKYDRNYFIDKKILLKNNSKVIPGSGVNLTKFKYCKMDKR